MNPGDRLVRLGAPISLFKDALLQVSLSNPISTDSATGRAQAYLAAGRFDWVVTGTGVTTTVHSDSAGRALASAADTWTNASLYPSLQAPADATPTGGSLMIPRGDYTVPTGGLVLNKTILVQGEPSTRLFAYSAAANQPVIKLSPGGAALTDVTLRDLTLGNVSEPSGPLSGNYGLQCDVPSDNSKVGRLVLERLNVSNMGDDGIHLHATGTNDSFFVFVAIRDVQCTDNRGRGLYAANANLMNAYGSYFLRNDLDGVRAESSEVTFHACGFEKNCSSTDTSRIDATFDGQVYLRTCAISRFDGCHFEEFTGAAPRVNNRGLMIENSPCCVVSGCRFVNSAEPPSVDDRGIACTYGAGVPPTIPAVPGVMACVIMPNWFSKVHTAVEIDIDGGLAQDCVVFPQRIEPGTTGIIKMPTTVSDSGLVILGDRRLPTGLTSTTRGIARGIFVPPRENTEEDSLPDLTSSEAGYMLLDMSFPALRIWTGDQWLRVVLTV